MIRRDQRLMIRPAWVALVAGLAMGSCGPHAVLNQDYDRFHTITVGMTEQEVRQNLGQPVHVHEKATAPKDYYVKG
jgi:hypothetical protein